MEMKELKDMNYIRKDLYVIYVMELKKKENKRYTNLIGSLFKFNI